MTTNLVAADMRRRKLILRGGCTSERAPRISNSRGCFLIALLATLLSAACLAPAQTNSAASRGTVIVVVGAPGQPEFGSNFVRQAEQWRKACNFAGYREIAVGLDTSSTNDLESFRQTLDAEPKTNSLPLWLVLIGHGTFDGKEARFNLRGPDVAATDLALWLKPFQRPMAIIDTTSSSAPFINKLSGTNRVVITATRSGNEQNFARFGQYFAEAIADPQADLDKDGQVSLLEAFLIASRRAGEFYRVEGRLATEHALLDDTGDGLGTPADWYRGVRAMKRPRDNAALDGILAQQFYLIPGEAEQKLTPEQRAQRDALERAVLLYREKKSQVPEDQYYQQLEKLLLELARFYSSNSVPAQSTRPVPETNSSTRLFQDMRHSPISFVRASRTNRRSASPKDFPTIARRFNAGDRPPGSTVPKGRLTDTAVPSGLDELVWHVPGVKTPGYCHMFLRNRIASAAA